MPVKGPLTAEEKEVCKALFDGLDADGDGKISADDLASILQGEGFQLTTDECQEFISKADLSGDGNVTEAEFMKICEKRPIKTRIASALRVLFDELDTDGSGYITVDNLQQLVKDAGYGGQVSDDELKELIARVDTAGDGKVSFDEFVAVFLE